MELDPLKYVETALSLDRKSARFVFFGFFALALSAALVSQVQGLNLPFFAVPVAMLMLGVVIAALSRMSGMLKTLLSWVLILLFLAWLTAFVLQAITGSRMTPPLASASCMLTPWEMQCQITQQSAALAASVPAASPVPAQTAVQGADPVALPDNNRVFVQFATLPRELVVAMNASLVAEGWKVAEADKGGEQLAAAEGLMEVRFFHAEDAALAQALAGDITEFREAAPPVGIRDFSQTALAARVPAGQLEAWISR